MLVTYPLHIVHDTIHTWYSVRPCLGIMPECSTLPLMRPPNNAVCREKFDQLLIDCNSTSFLPLQHGFRWGSHIMNMTLSGMKRISGRPSKHVQKMSNQEKGTDACQDPARRQTTDPISRDQFLLIKRAASNFEALGVGCHSPNTPKHFCDHLPQQRSAWGSSLFKRPAHAELTRNPGLRGSALQAVAGAFPGVAEHHIDHQYWQHKGLGTAGGFHVYRTSGPS